MYGWKETNWFKAEDGEGRLYGIVELTQSIDPPASCSDETHSPGRRFRTTEGEGLSPVGEGLFRLEPSGETLRRIQDG